VERVSIIEIMQIRNKVSKENKTLDKQKNGNDFITNVVCSCYMCGKSIEQPEEQYDMYGEIVCQDCWDYNMYQALQDGGGM
jgi:hypothetical protein